MPVKQNIVSFIFMKKIYLNKNLSANVSIHLIESSQTHCA